MIFIAQTTIIVLTDSFKLEFILSLFWHMDVPPLHDGTHKKWADQQDSDWKMRLVDSRKGSAASSQLPGKRFQDLRP